MDGEGEEGTYVFMVMIETQGNVALPFLALATTLLSSAVIPSPA